MKLIPLSASRKSKHGGKHFAQVDDEDYDEISKFNWHVSFQGLTIYAHRTEMNGTSKTTISLHRHIMGAIDKNIEIDHEDHNGLNCQRYNLRIASHSQNAMNVTAWGKSKYLGVYWNKGRSKWQAQITINKKQTYIGRYDTEEDAARAYDDAAKKHHGDFANLNFKVSVVE